MDLSIDSDISNSVSGVSDLDSVVESPRSETVTNTVTIGSKTGSVKKEIEKASI